MNDLRNIDWPRAIVSVVRHGITTTGGALLAASACGAALFDQNWLGIVLVVGGILWGVWDKRERWLE